MKEGSGEEGDESTGPSGDVTCMGKIKSEFKVTNFGLSHPEPHLFVSSQWGFPWLYLIWRVFWAVYHVGWIVDDLVYNSLNNERPLTWLAYLTDWGYTLLTVNTVCLAILQIYVVCTRKDFRDGESRWYLKGTWLMYTVTSDSCAVITLLYFVILFDGNWTLTRTILHLMNSVYVIVDLCVTATPIRLFHVIYTVIFAAIYIVFSVIYWCAGGVNEEGESYIYAALDWSNPAKAAPMSVAVLVALVPLIHVILWSLYMLRVIIWNSIFLGRKGERGRRRDEIPLQNQ